MPTPRLSPAWVATSWKFISDRTIRSARSCGLPDGAKPSKQLIIDTRASIPANLDTTSVTLITNTETQHGVANLFMVFAPLEGWRHVKVTDRHTAIDYAHVPGDLSDTHFPDAVKIVLVQDNLNIHCASSRFAEAFPAPEAPPARRALEWHYTPKHGSAFDMARIRTLGVLCAYNA